MDGAKNIRTMCPRCGRINIMEKPKTARKTLDFACECDTHYRVNIAEMEHFTPDQRGKPKPYMNREERDKFIFAYIAAETLCNWVLAVPGLPEVSHFAYKQAQNMLAMGAYEWVREKQPETVAQIKRDADMYTLVLTPKRDMKVVIARNRDIEAALRNEVLQESRDPVFDLSLATFQFCCQKCDGAPACSKSGCIVKDALEQLQIPTWDAMAECPYAYAGLTDEEIQERKNSVSGVEPESKGG